MNELMFSKYYILKLISSITRMCTILYIPLILTTDFEFEKYGTFIVILSSISIVSGFGVPVELVKKYGENIIEKKVYNNILLPLHVVSIIPLYFLAIAISPEMVGLNLIVSILFILSETLFLDILRQHQIRSEYKIHILRSFYKSISLFVIIAFFAILSNKISFQQFLVINIIINFLIILSTDYFKNIEIIKGIKSIDIRLLKISFPYFLMYFIDKYLISFDRTLFLNYLEAENYKKFILIFPILLAAFNLIEGSVFLKDYNNVFTGKLKFYSFFKMALILSLLSIFISIIIYYYILFTQNIILPELQLFLSSFTFILFSSIGWYFNIVNYKNKSSFQFLLISIVIGTIYLLFIKIFFTMNLTNIFILICMLPASVAITNFAFVKKSII